MGPARQSAPETTMTTRVARPIGIDLFAGAGGMSLGFEQAGVDVAAAIEIDPVHAATHAFNFPLCAVIPRSVVGLSAADILDAAHLGRGSVDVVFGGAPCQGFSLIGQRAIDDPRNELVREFIRLVVELDAPYFVFENVKGLTQGAHRVFLDEILSTFDDAGYMVSRPWRVLNALDFGVPQDRSRLILIGAKRGAVRLLNVRVGSWSCKNSNARRARRNILEKLRFMRTDDAADIRLSAVWENCIFYIFPMYTQFTS